MKTRVAGRVNKALCWCRRFYIFFFFFTFPMVFCRWYNTAPLWGAVSLRLLCLALVSFLSSPLPVCLSGTWHHMQWLWAVVPHVKSSAGKSESLGLMLCGLGVSQLCSLE